MNFFRGRRGFSLLELLIALSIIIIMTGAAALYLGDVLYKAKVAKAKNDMDTIVTAVVLHDAEMPSQTLDSGLPGSSAQSRLNSTLAAPSVLAAERGPMGNLVGTYLLASPQDPWNADYKINGYAGWVKSYGENFAISGTSKYDKDITSYYLPESLFLAKVRAEDLNDNAVFDTGDSVTMYFSKSVRCNLDIAAAAGANFLPYRGAAVTPRINQYGLPMVDVHYVAADETAVDSAGSAATFTLGCPDPHPAATTVANKQLASWTPHDLYAYAPGAYDSGASAKSVEFGTSKALGETAGIEGNGNPALNQYAYGFHRPADNLYFASCFSRNLKFWMGRTSVSHGSDASNLDIGYEIYIPTSSNTAVTTDNINRQYAYAIWESSKGYAAYKTSGEKAKIYLQVQSRAAARRTLVWKDITD